MKSTRGEKSKGWRKYGERRTKGGRKHGERRAKGQKEQTKGMKLVSGKEEAA